MDPNWNETTAQLIARKPGNLNVLITARFTVPGRIDCRGRIVASPQSWNSVMVRYNYSELDLGDDDARSTGMSVATLSDGSPDVEGIERAVAQFRKLWGPLPIHDNSGALALPLSAP